MKKEIDFSIIIPTYNRGKFIFDTIKSVLDQDYDNFELIVIDDGSTDNTKQIISIINDPRLKYIFKSNEERAIARNTGIIEAKGKYITFLDSDDRLFSNHLKEAINFIRKNDQIDFFHLAYQIRNVITGKITKVISDQKTTNHLIIKGNLLSCNGVFIKNEVSKQNLFNETRALTTLEDWELWLRLSTKLNLFSVPIITSEILDHENRSVLAEDKSKLIEKFRVFMKIVLDNEEITSYHQRHLNQFKSSCYTYISLHIALTKKDRSTSIKYLIKGIIASPKSIFTRRFLAIIKHLLY